MRVISILLIIGHHSSVNFGNIQKAKALPIMGISFTLPFICISSILKGYFYGKENMGPYVISNIIEQTVRLLFIIFMIPKLMIYGIDVAVLGVVLINVISEFASIICLILFIPHKKISVCDLKFDRDIFKDVLKILYAPLWSPVATLSDTNFDITVGIPTDDNVSNNEYTVYPAS